MMQARAPRVSNVKSNKAVAKPFCGVCFKAGKSETEYTSHYTKSVPGEGGVVICPTILGNECTYCHELGHFKNACPRLASKNLDYKKSLSKNVSTPIVKKMVTVTVPRVKTSNVFSALDSDSDDDNDDVKSVEDVVLHEDFPALCVNKKSNNNYEMSYASMAAKPVPEVVEVADDLSGFVALKLDSCVNSRADFRLLNTGKNIHHSWADDDYWSDNDDM